MIRGVLSPDPVGNQLSLIGDRSSAETACNVDAEAGCLWSIGISSFEITGRPVYKIQLIRSPSMCSSAWMSAYSGDCDRLFRPNVTGDSAGSAL
jgi:hypothetical protein